MAEQHEDFVIGRTSRFARLTLHTHLTAANVTVVTAAGEVDFSTRDDLDDLLRSIEELQPAQIILDLRKVTFMDSSGIHVVVSAHRRAQGAPWQFSLLLGPGSVAKTFRVAGLEDELSFVSRLPADLPG